VNGSKIFFGNKADTNILFTQKNTIIPSVIIKEGKNINQMKSKRILTAFLLASSLLLAGCSGSGDNATVQENEQTNSEQTNQGDTSMETEEMTDIVTTLAKIDSSKWNYNEEDGVYWQVGISYCENHADEKYEALGIFVPEAYLSGTDNGDGTFTCQLNE
jgi:hypothetical protein